MGLRTRLPGLCDLGLHGSDARLFEFRSAADRGRRNGRPNVIVDAGRYVRDPLRTRFLAPSGTRCWRAKSRAPGPAVGTQRSAVTSACS